jgi:hypothetical protein
MATNTTPIPYSQLAPTLKTGDVILFQGTVFADLAIEELEKVEGLPQYSHIGMVYLPTDDPTNIQIWQAAPAPDAEAYGNDYIKGVPADGAQLVSLQTVLEWCNDPSKDHNNTYNVAARHLTPALSSSDFTLLDTFVREMVGRSFSQPEATGMMDDYYKGANGEQTSNATFFCSKLVAATYQGTGILPPQPVGNTIPEPTMITNSVLPGDFGQGATRLTWLKGYTLGDEIPFILPPATGS